MNSIDFCYWLQGYFEISDAKEITPTQLEVIKNHINLVFKHEIDPLRDSQTSTPASILNSIHSLNDSLVRC